jgi:hypothetical protein
MSVKAMSSRLEKDIQKTALGLEELFKSLGNFVSSTFGEMVGTVVESKKKVTKAKAVKTRKAKVSKPAKAKKTVATAEGRGRPSGGGLKEALIQILSDTSDPLTEADIAKKLLENQEKYKWNKNESTLYQTLRRAVKEKLISDSGRDKETKTYKVA